MRRIFENTIARCVVQEVLPVEAKGVDFAVETPKNPAHGDYAVNAAMLLAKLAGKPPRAVAQLLIDHLDDPDLLLSSLEIAGPGFINVRLDPAFFFRGLRRVDEEGDRFGNVGVGDGKRVLVEYVSANPTGPMHVGHGRGAVTGDAISRLLAAAGYDVTREYYVNDAGGQVTALARSVWVRAREIWSEEHPASELTPVALGEDDYKGEYIKDVAGAVIAAWPEAEREALVAGPFGPLRDRIANVAVQVVLDTMIKPDLAYLGIHFDKWFSERSLHESGEVDRAIRALEARGFVEEKVLPPPKGIEREAQEADERPQLVFTSTRFGDDADRPLRKGDGNHTYFAADMAYHWDKLERGYPRLINVWGADHGGYVPRVRAAIQALGHPPETLDVVLVQMVNLLKNGQPVKMGKRSGNFITLRWLLDEVGSDAVRVFFLMRRGDAMLDFDVDLAKAQSKDNPVFYVQYGHARCASILRKAIEAGLPHPGFSPDHADSLTMPEELELTKRILAFPDVVAAAAQALEPHRIVFYIQETTALFQHYYEAGKRAGEKVIGDDPAKTEARLFLIASVKQVLANALALLGVSAPERMERASEEIAAEESE
ncbi:Arginyl-tRNA synthetase [Vulgatibacter incomptus]|uniref:Arginine--tRNA ligase n=1 Tax=Vulgatibacter incomptus TaxID=1391653 RepID=A0A0K1PBY3_9BACT|nr:Arginyl-tRNA synthetase [Vulgatibacter incomptus]